MRHLSALCFAVIMLLTACQSEEQKAQQIIAKAQQSYQTGQYNQAKIEIDSMRRHFPNEFDAIREGLQLMRKIELKENQRTLQFADSILAIRRVQADSLFQYFTFNKEAGIEDMGHFTPKRLTVERNVERNYIRAQVNEYGDLTLSSVYYGPRQINHTGLKMEIGDGSNAQTLAVAYDGGRNYRFKDNDHYSEIVTYDAKAQNGLVDFITHYNKERIKVRYTGGSSYIIYLDDVSKQAIQDASALSFVLSEITRLQQEQKIASEKISFLETKIAKKERAIK